MGWVIQNEALVRLPDDAPLPSGSVPVEPPEDFLERPDAYRVQGRYLVRRSDEELERLRPRGDAVKLTQEEIIRLKQILAEQEAGRTAPPRSKRGAASSR